LQFGGGGSSPGQSCGGGGSQPQLLLHEDELGLRLPLDQEAEERPPEPLEELLEDERLEIDELLEE